MNRTIFLSVVAAAVIAGASAQAPAPKPLPEIACDEAAEGYCNIRLAIVDPSIDKNSRLVLTVGGRHNDRKLEFRIAIALDMQKGDMNPITLAPQPYSVKRGGIHFVRTDDSSDQFVAALAKLYRTKERPAAMDDDIHFNAFAVRGDPDKIMSKDVLFELSHDDPANKVPECELLLDVNVAKGVASLNEKNEDFRECAMRVLGRPRPVG